MEYKIPIFSYGSNSISQIKGRLKNINLVSYPAYANGYKRIFCGYSKNWNGGVATLIKKRFIKTYGIIVYLDNNELSKLDSYESTYIKKEIICNILINNIYSECKCITYIAKDNKWISLPSEQYLIAIKTMLEEHFSKFINYIIISKKDDNNKIQNIMKWKFPKNINELSLESLFVISNSYKNIQWSIPKNINIIVYKLNSVNIFNINKLIKYLINEECFNKLNNKLLNKNHKKISYDTFLILNKLLIQNKNIKI
jgi:hypothetical protein